MHSAATIPGFVLPFIPDCSGFATVTITATGIASRAFLLRCVPPISAVPVSSHGAELHDTRARKTEELEGTAHVSVATWTPTLLAHPTASNIRVLYTSNQLK
jgi:hypothetical protein